MCVHGHSTAKRKCLRATLFCHIVARARRNGRLCRYPRVVLDFKHALTTSWLDSVWTAKGCAFFHLETQRLREVVACFSRTPSSSCLDKTRQLCLYLSVPEVHRHTVFIYSQCLKCPETAVSVGGHVRVADVTAKFDQHQHKWTKREPHVHCDPWSLLFAVAAAAAAAADVSDRCVVV